MLGNLYLRINVTMHNIIALDCAINNLREQRMKKFQTTPSCYRVGNNILPK